jgi:hypothetical protein
MRTLQAAKTEQAYLEPNSGSLQKTIEGSIAIGLFRNQKHDEKSIPALSFRTIYSLYKGV